MSLISLDIKPGLFRDRTRYGAEGFWYDCDKVRFRKGVPEKIGGWVKKSNQPFYGSGRYIHDWSDIDGNRYAAVGTHLKLYVNLGEDYYDVTPLRTTNSLGSDPIDTVDGTGLITVNDTGHGAVVGDYVTLSGAATTNGIPDTDINVEHKIVSVVDADSYMVVCATAATSTASGGGSSIEAAYQVNVGLDTYVGSSGWGVGVWGAGAWGGATAVTAANQLRIWSLDNFGDDLVANVRLGGIYYWDESGGLSTRAIKIQDLTRRSVTLGTDPITTTMSSATLTITDSGGHGAGVGDTVTLAGASTTNGVPDSEINAAHTIVSVPTDTTFTITVSTSASSGGSGGGSSVTATYNAGVYYTPSKALQVMVSNVARHILVFGASPIGSTDFDPMFVRWCSSENAAEWQPLETNTAGGQRLSSGSTFIGAIRTREEILAWTDTGITSIIYVGVPFVFSFRHVAEGVSMLSPNAAINANAIVFFMDRGGFYTYAGRIRRLVCPIRDYVFSDIDLDQSFKVVAGSINDFSEVIWLYQSINGNDVDKYVLYNYDEDLWSFGTLARGYWDNSFTKLYPMASSINRDYLSNNPISTSSASSTITVSHTDHGLSAGDTIIINGSSDVGGIDELVINDQHTIASVVDDDSYTITVSDDASSTATGGGDSIDVYKPNYLYYHENGHDDDGGAMNAYIEAGDMDIGDGDDFWFITRLIPDVIFRDSSDSSDSVTISLKGHDYPAQTQTTKSSVSVTPTTEQNHIRARTRQVAFRIESTGSGYGWRLGRMRLDVRKDGSR